jgi:iron complex transport system ATP-binding protein
VTVELLRLEGVVDRRGALDLGPVDLVVRAGESVALVGPNGAGKSTLVALAVGERRPARGRALLAGDASAGLPRQAVAMRASVLRQQPPAALPLPALEVVLHGRWAHLAGLKFPGAGDLTCARDALARVGALHLADRDFRDLSGGERQRVLIAKALAQASPLLILDEPTAGLDLKQRTELMGLCATLVRERRRGILLVTHELDMAAALADRVIVLVAGRVLAAGTPGEVLTEDIIFQSLGTAVHVFLDTATGRPHVAPRWPV